MRRILEFISEKIVLLLIFAVPIAVAVALIISFANQDNEPKEPEEPFESVVAKYPQDEVDRYFYYKYNDAVALEDYQDLEEEKESIEFAYNNALDIIGYYVGKYGEFDGYDERDFVADGYYVDYRNGESGDDFAWNWQAAAETHQKEVESRK